MNTKFSITHVILLLTLGLIAHNFYLQEKLDALANQSNSNDSDEIISTLDDIQSKVDDIESTSYEASVYARAAASSAEDAYYQAQQAANNAFGNQCWSCP